MVVFGGFTTRGCPRQAFLGGLDLGFQLRLLRAGPGRLAMAHPLGTDRFDRGHPFAQCHGGVPPLLGGREGGIRGRQRLFGLRLAGACLFQADPGVGTQLLLTSLVLLFGGQCQPGCGEVVGQQAGAGVAQFRLHDRCLARNGRLPTEGLELAADL